MAETDFDAIAELRKYFIDDGHAREVRQNELLDQIIRENARRAAYADLLRRALVCVEAHAEEYPAARPLVTDIKQALDMWV